MDKVEQRVVIHNLGLQGLAPKEIHEDMVETLGKAASPTIQ